MLAALYQLVDSESTQTIPYFASFRGLADYGQVGIVLGIVAGSYISRYIAIER